MPFFSIIVPIYNTEKYLSKCLDSLIAQTLSDIEIICVNDAATDGSAAILNQYAEKDKRIKIIELNENGGAAKARNIGIETATGEYLGFVDSDDFLDLDFYEKLYSKAIETNADAVKGNYRQAATGYIDEELNQKVKENKNNFSYTFCSAIYKRDVINRFEIRFPDLCDMEDPVFTFKFAIVANKVEVVETSVNLVQREDSQTSKVPDLKRIKDRIRGLQMLVDIAQNIPKESYLYVMSLWLYCTYTNSIRNTEKSVRKYLADNLLETVDHLKYRTDVFASLSQKDDFLRYCLETKNVEYLILLKKRF